MLMGKPLASQLKTLYAFNQREQLLAETRARFQCTLSARDADSQHPQIRKRSTAVACALTVCALLSIQNA